MVFCATARIDETDPEELAGSRRVNAGYPECSRSSYGGVRFGVRCGPRTPKILAAKTVMIGGAGRNRTNLNNPDRGRKSLSLLGARTIQANSGVPRLTPSLLLLTVSLTVGRNTEPNDSHPPMNLYVPRLFDAASSAAEKLGSFLSLA